MLQRENLPRHGVRSTEEPYGWRGDPATGNVAGRRETGRAQDGLSESETHRPQPPRQPGGPRWVSLRSTHPTSRLHASHVGLFAILAGPREVRSGQPQAHVRIPRLPAGGACGLRSPHRRKLAFDRLETAFDVIRLCAARADDERGADTPKALTLLNALRPTADKGAGGRDVRRQWRQHAVVAIPGDPRCRDQGRRRGLVQEGVA